MEESYPLSRHRLCAGQQLRQTRRTIDLAEDCGAAAWRRHRGLRFVIIGSQKSGTTSLYEYLHQHPMVLRGKRRETHNFDWRWVPSHSHSHGESKSGPEPSQGQLEHYLRYFEHETLLRHASLVSGESTPSYLLHADLVLPRLLETAPWVKVRTPIPHPHDTK